MAKKTFPKRRGKRDSQPSPELEFEPWTRRAQQSVIGGISILVVLLGAFIWAISDNLPDDLLPREPLDVAARRAALADANSGALDKAFARLSWGDSAGATKVALGQADVVNVPVVDGRAVATVSVVAPRHATRQLIGFQVAVFAGERRLFGNTLRTQDAAGPTDVVSISFNADAVRAAEVGAEPLTVRVSLAEIGRRRNENGEPPEDPTLGEARLRIALP